MIGAFCFEKPKQYITKIWFTRGSVPTPHAVFTGESPRSIAQLSRADVAHCSASAELCDLLPLMSAALASQGDASHCWHLSVFLGHAVWSSQQVTHSRTALAAAFHVNERLWPGRSFWEKLRGATGRWAGRTMYAKAPFLYYVFVTFGQVRCLPKPFLVVSFCCVALR